MIKQQCNTGLPMSANVSPSKGLSRESELLAILSCLRLHLSIQDLGRRMILSVGKMSAIFQKWINVVYIKLKFLIFWPQREVLQQNMPLAFQQTFPNCRVIIDCFKIIIETPSSFDACAKIYSNYKKHNTKIFDWYNTMWYNFLFVPMLGWTHF